MPEHTPLTKNDLLKVAEMLRNSLPREVDEASLTLKSRLPFKALVLREALIHRVSSLTDSSLSEYEAGRWVAASILARAILETVAAIYSLEKAIRRTLANGSWQELAEHLTRSLVSAKGIEGFPESLSTLTQIEKLEKKFSGYSSIYGSLCEYAHPNWAGVLFAFSEADTKKRVVSFGRFERNEIGGAFLSALMGSLAIAQLSYNSCSVEIDSLNKAFESGVLSHET